MPHSPSDPRPEDISARFDDLSRRTDNGFNRVDAKVNQVDAKVDRLSERMAAEFTAVRKEISEGFQRMQRLMIQVGGGIVITLLVASRLFS